MTTPEQEIPDQTTVPDATTADFQTTHLADAGDAGRLDLVKLEDLNVDQSYQRDLSRDLVEKIKSNWDSAAAGPIVVSRRPNGSLYIVNGQHRVAAAMELGRVEIVAQVLNGLGPAQEAELRLMGNTRRSDSSLERFRAQVAAGHSESLAIQSVLQQFNTQVNQSVKQDTGINAVSTVEGLYRHDEGRSLVSVLEVLTEAFGAGELHGRIVGANMLKGVAWFLHRHRSEIDRARYIERLHAEGDDALDRKARNYRASSGGPLWLNYYRAMVEVYNYRLTDRHKLEPRTGNYAQQGGGGSDWDK